jgi:cytochrome c oxidase subunit 2
MYIQDIVETFYIGLVIIYIVFIVSFIYLTSKGSSKELSRDGGEVSKTSRMERSEKTWLFTLIIIAIIGNAIFLSPLIPSARTTLWMDEQPIDTIYITMSNYTFHLPNDIIRVSTGQPVEFVIYSDDVTYGFGVFDAEGKLIFQIQVLPNYENRITWIFDEPGYYTIRSTEYSGPRHSEMVLYDVIYVEEGG